jgi:hypothetical protein
VALYPLNAELPLGYRSSRATLRENDRGAVLDGAAYGVAHARFGGDLELSSLSGRYENCRYCPTQTGQRHTCAPTAIWRRVQRDFDALRGAPELVTVTPPRLRWSITLGAGARWSLTVGV